MWYQRKRLYAALLIVLLLVLYLDREWLGRLMYPMMFAPTIVTETTRYDVDPYLATSIIRVESNFRADKLSPKGAVGLMQLMPPTAEWIIEQSGGDPSHLGRLNEPEVNIRYGVWYLRALREQFVEAGDDKETEIALIAAAYNAGPGNVDKWLKEGTWSGRFEDTAQIPFGETRHYVHRVYYYYHKYEQAYPELRAAERNDSSE